MGMRVAWRLPPIRHAGQTVNIAARVQDLARAEEICLTTEVLDAPGVREALAPFAVECQVMQLKGIMQHVPVFRVTTRLAAAGVGTMSGDAPAVRSTE
jgi:class 3 adenylate cyclase